MPYISFCSFCRDGIDGQPATSTGNAAAIGTDPASGGYSEAATVPPTPTAATVAEAEASVIQAQQLKQEVMEEKQILSGNEREDGKEGDIERAEGKAEDVERAELLPLLIAASTAGNGPLSEVRNLASKRRKRMVRVGKGGARACKDWIGTYFREAER